jgi:hypothetical protein
MINRDRLPSSLRGFLPGQVTDVERESEGTVIEVQNDPRSCEFSDKSEVQLLEDTFVHRASVIAGLFSPRGVSALVSPIDDDQLVNYIAQDEDQTLPYAQQTGKDDSSANPGNGDLDTDRSRFYVQGERYPSSAMGERYLEDQRRDGQENLTEQGKSSNLPDNLSVNSHRLCNKSEGQHPEHPTEGLTTVIGGLINSPWEVPCVERTGSDDPLV